MFEVAAESYDRFMGRFSVQLSPQLADLANVHDSQDVLDVGCGPGALTAQLVERVGAAHVTAVDPSASFVAAARERHPDVEVRQAAAEELPFPDARFDAALAQLVVHFMRDPVAGLSEMRRVTRDGGVVAACVWDQSARSPLTPFWRVVRELDPTADAEAHAAGGRAGELRALMTRAGLRTIEETELDARVTYETFDEWWEPMTFGVGPAGTYAVSLDDDRRSELRERCRRELSDGPFTIAAAAWAARGVV